MEKYTEILKQDLFLKLLKEEINKLDTSHKPKVTLVGGAVIDILRGVRPKDYDLLHNSILEKALKENPNFKLEYTSKSAMTFSINGFIVQLLYKNVSEFSYSIERSEYDVTVERLLKLDVQSFEHRVLIPSETAFLNKKIARCAIRRILHHQKKGWVIPNITFQSLCDTAFKGDKQNVES